MSAPRFLKGLTARSTSPRAQSIIITAARVTAGLLSIGIPLVLVRVFDKSTFGVYKQLFLVALTLHPFLNLGLGPSLYYFVPRLPEQASRYQMQTFLLLTGLGLLGGLGVIAGAEALSAFFDAPLEPYLTLIALYVALSVPGSLLTVVPIVDRRAQLAGVLEVTSQFVKAAALIAVALFTRALEPVLIAACATMGAQYLVTACYMLAGHRSRPTLETLRQQLSYALPFASATWIGLVRQRVHAFYVGARFSDDEFATYAAATVDIPLIQRLSGTIGEIVVLENSEHDAAGRPREQRRVWHRATLLLSLILFPVWALSELFAYEMIEVLFTSGYTDAVPIFRVFMLTLPLSIFLGSPMLRAAREMKQLILADVAALAGVVAVLVLFAPAYGVLAAVSSLVVGQAVYVGVSTRRTAQRLELGLHELLPWRQLAGVTLVSFAAAVVGWFTAELTGAGSLVRLLLGGTVGMGVYLALSWLTGLIPESERELIRSLPGRIRR